jgi:TRAP-type transport system periplasmic protein
VGYRSGAGATKLVNAYYNKFKPQEFEETKVMYPHAHGPGLVHTSRKPLKTLDDLRGVKIRATGTMAKIVGALGATQVAMPMSDTYDALSRGIVDGIMCPAEALSGWKLGEVVKYTTLNYGCAYTIGFFVVMNKAKWDSLPPHVQNVIQKVNEGWIVKQGEVWDELDMMGMEFAKRQGVQMVSLSREEEARWAKALQPIFDDYVKRMRARGMSFHFNFTSTLPCGGLLNGALDVQDP